MSKDQVHPTFGQLIAMLPKSSVLTDEVLSKLNAELGEQPLDEFSNMAAFELGQMLLTVFTDADGYDNGQRLSITMELHELLSKFSGNTKSTGQPQMIQVTHMQEKTPDQMTLNELLTQLAGDRGLYFELQQLINCDLRVITASRVTALANHAWVVPNADGKGIDVPLTMEYVNHLNEPFASRTPDWKGRRQITLESAVGRNTQAIIHPFTGRPITGPDELGFDFSTLPGQKLEALIWGRQTSHQAWPSVVDRYSHSMEVLGSWGGRWEIILRDYTSTVNDDETNKVSRFWPKHLGLDQVYAFQVIITAAVEVRDDEFYRSALLDVAQAHENSISGPIYMSRTVLTSFHSISGPVSLTDVIVLRKSSTVSAPIDGMIYLAPGASISSISGPISARRQNKSWKQLYELAQSWDIV